MTAPTSTSPARCDGIGDIAQRIRAAGARFNDEREAVVAALLRASQPLDAEEVWHAARQAGSSIHRATTYRTVAVLTALEIIEVAAVRRRRKVYQIKRARPSVHMVRADIGTVQEIVDEPLLAALMDAARRHGYRLIGGVEMRVAPLLPAPPSACA